MLYITQKIQLISNSFQTHFQLNHTFSGTSFAFLGLGFFNFLKFSLFINFSLIFFIYFIWFDNCHVHHIDLYHFLSLLDTYEKVKLTKCFISLRKYNSFPTHSQLHHTFGGTSFAFLGPRGSPLAVKNGLILWIRLNLICSTTRKNYKNLSPRNANDVPPKVW